MSAAATPPPGGVPGKTPPAPAAPAAAPSHPRRPLWPDATAKQRERIVDVLWELQQQRGYLDDEAIRIAGVACGLSPQEVDEVATFYNLLLRQPAGRIPLFVCDSISCELNGGAQLMLALARVLGVAPGGVSADGMFGLLPIVCLGHCDKAPCLLAGETVHGPCGVDDAAVRALLKEIGDAAGAARSAR